MKSNWWNKYIFFSKYEFDCKCCGKNKMKEEFIDLLENMRAELKFPFIINSGYRCEKHNKEIGGKPNSAHLKGLASDIQINNTRKRFKLIDLAIKKGIKRIGIYNTFIHIDIDKTLPQRVMWYGKTKGGNK